MFSKDTYQSIMPSFDNIDDGSPGPATFLFLNPDGYAISMHGRTKISRTDEDVLFFSFRDYEPASTSDGLESSNDQA